MNILITSAGKRVSLVNAFKKELKAVFTAGKVFAADSNPQLSAACMMADGWFKVPSLASPNYINELIKICKINNISLIIPTDITCPYDAGISISFTSSVLATMKAFFLISKSTFFSIS